MKLNNVLVVGGAGFIGSFLCKELINKCNVICLDNLMRGSKKNISNLLNDKNFTFIESDASNTKTISNLIKKHNINYILHLAANSDIQYSASNPQIEFDSTAKTTWSILMAMKETGVKNLFFASTSAVYGQSSDKSFKENDQLCPISYYGSAKMASEAFISAFSYMNDINALIFRFPNVIGPNLTHGVFYDFIQRLKDNPGKLVVLGNGTQTKPYMHVSDLAKAIDMLLWQNHGINIFNVGVNSSTSVKEIAEMVVSEMGLPNCKIEYGDKNIGWKGDVSRFSYCLDKIHSTGWKASMTSNEASLRTIREVLNDDNL